MTNSGFYSDYYDLPEHWGSALDDVEEERIKSTLQLIPQDCHSILEVGCGDGRIINRLALQDYIICGMDISRQALKYVKSTKMLGSIDALPFLSKSFDLVICSEVLEHLPFHVYQSAIEELQRVAAKYIIVSVPRRQMIKKGMVTCPACNCVFRRDRHVRSFNEKIIASLIKNFSLNTVISYRPRIKVYFPIIMPVAKLLHLTATFPTRALCPQCGYLEVDKRNSAPTNQGIKNVLLRHLRPLARCLMHTKICSGWLIVIYNRDT